MITFPIAKINLGLNVVERRPDGYHNLETVFYPVPICDALEVQPMDGRFPSEADCDLKVTNIIIEGDERRNLVVRAYELLKQEFPGLPRVHAHLFKQIPTQAGMGGGSSDGAAMMTLLNEMFGLGLTASQMVERVVKLGPTAPSSSRAVRPMPRASASGWSPWSSRCVAGTWLWCVLTFPCRRARPSR